MKNRYGRLSAWVYDIDKPVGRYRPGHPPAREDDVITFEATRAG